MFTFGPHREPQPPPPQAPVLTSCHALVCPALTPTACRLWQRQGLSSNGKTPPLASFPEEGAMPLSLGQLWGSWAQCGCNHLL